MFHEYFDLHVAGLMIACMRETYGKPLSSYMKSEKLSLRSSQPNLFRMQNPGSKFLLECIESRKKQVNKHFFFGYTYRNEFTNVSRYELSKANCNSNTILNNYVKI